MKSLIAIAAATFAAAASAVVPEIRWTGDVPFRDGARVESAWSRADVMTDFTTAESFDAAIDRSEAQALFDAKNLYVSLKGFFDPKALEGAGLAEARRRNRFEVFVQPDVAKPYFVQVMASQDGSLYCGEFVEGIKRKCEHDTGVALSVSDGKDFWVANLAIPLRFLKCVAPKGDRPVKIGIMRRNVSLAGGRTEETSYTPVIANYGLPEYWSDATMTRRPGKAREVPGDVKDFKVNYFPNPEFDVPGRCWTAIPKGGQVVRMEESEFGGEWMWRTTGSTYRFLEGRPSRFEPDTDYTLMVKARACGGEGALQILTMKKLPDGRPAEGVYLGGHLELGKDFHVYYFPFHTDTNRQTVVNFYRVGPAGDGKGVDIAAIKLFRGRVSPLEIRPYSRFHQKQGVGPGIPMRPNPYGKRREKLRVLAFERSKQGVRVIQEIFAGLNVELDVLSTTAKDQDIYETDGDVAAILGRIEKGEYGLFIVGMASADEIGAEMAGKVLERVKGGAGLYMLRNPRLGHFADAVGAAGLAPLGADHVLRRAYPCGMYKVGRWDRPSPDNAKVGKIGNGRLLHTYDGRIRPRMDPAEYGVTDFPFADFVDPWVARTLYWTAGVDADVSGAVRGKGATLSADNLGKRIVASRVADRDGFTLDWTAEIVDRTGPLLDVKTVVDSVKGDAPAVFEVAAKGGKGRSALRAEWRLYDCDGRVLEKGEGFGRVEVPTRALYTNMGRFRVTLFDGADAVDRFVAGVYARDRDIARTTDDFTVSVWPMGEAASPETIAAADVELKKMGVRASLLPIGNTHANTLSSGLALGGGFLGDPRVFCCGMPQTGNVRLGGELSTSNGLDRLARCAREEAAKSAKFGVTEAVVCDEPGFTMRYSTLEPCEHPENIAEYRRRMERKYGTVAEYNRRHRSSFSSFSEIGPVHLADARRSGDFAGFVEWRAFNTDRWCEAIRMLAENGKSIDPDLRLSLYNSFGQTALSGNDYWKLLTKAGLEFSNEYTSMVYMGRNAIYNFDEFYRSFRPDMRVWGFTGYRISTPQIMFTPWWFAAHRYGGFTWFAVWSWQWNLLDIPSCAWTRDAFDMKKSLDDSRVLHGLGKYTLEWDWAPRDVALYYSHESLVVSTLLGAETKSFEIGEKGPLHEYFYSRQGLQYLVESLLYQHDFVAPEQVEGGKLAKDGYRIVFMPRILALSDAEVAALKAFAARGGKIVADVAPGDYDELGVKRRANPFAKGEVEVLGKSFSDFDRAQHSRMLALLRGARATPALESAGIENLDGREAVHFTDGVSDMYMVLRMTARSQDDEEQTFTFPSKAHTYDVRAWRYLGDVDSAAARVPLSGASVFARFPFRPEALVLGRMPKSVTRGGDLVAAISLKADKPVPAGARFVYNVAVTRPDGSASFQFERNVRAPGGRAEFRFRVAHDDPRGKWKMTVTEPLTGLRAERRFSVD